MAIKIPSKNIYSYERNVIIENKIGCIELGVKKVQADNQRNAFVHSENLSLSEKIGGGGVQQDYNLDGRVGNQIVTIALAGVQLIPTYVKGRITIPINRGNSCLQRLILGVDNNGISNIRLRLSGDVFRGTTSNTLTYANPNHYNYLDKRNFDFDWNKTSFNQEQVNQGGYTIDTTHSYSVSYKMSALDTLTSSITMTLDNQDNLATVTATQTENNYILDVVVLCGLKVVKLGCTFTHKSSADKEVVPMSGEYLEYVPNLCELSFFGDTYGIKLVDEVIKIGDPKNGKTIRMGGGNELLQITDSNSPKIGTQSLMAKTAVQPIIQQTIKPTEKVNEWDNFDIPIYNGYVNLPALQKYRYVGSENCANKLAENSLATIYFIPTYVNTTVSIPIRRENEEVSHIIIGGGIDEEYGVGGTPINVHLYGKVNKGKAHATLTYDGKTKKGDIDLEKIVCEEQETTMQDYTLQTKQSYSCNNAYLEYELNSKDNVHTTTAIRTYDDHIEVDLTILIGLKVIKLGAIYDTSTTEKITADMNGVYEEYICGYCELTIYGATKQIELKENNNET